MHLINYSRRALPVSWGKCDINISEMPYARVATTEEAEKNDLNCMNWLIEETHVLKHFTMCRGNWGTYYFEKSVRDFFWIEKSRLFFCADFRIFFKFQEFFGFPNFLRNTTIGNEPYCDWCLLEVGYGQAMLVIGIISWKLSHLALFFVHRTNIFLCSIGQRLSLHR